MRGLRVLAGREGVMPKHFWSEEIGPFPEGRRHVIARGYASIARDLKDAQGELNALHQRLAERIAQRYENSATYEADEGADPAIQDALDAYYERHRHKASVIRIAVAELIRLLEYDVDDPYAETKPGNVVPFVARR